MDAQVASEAPGLSSRTPQVQVQKDVQMKGDSRFEKNRGATTATWARRTNNGHHDVDMGTGDNNDAKKQRTMCLNLAGSDSERSSEERMMEVYEAAQPLSVVTSDATYHGVRQHIWQSQRELMRYVVRFSGRHIVTNSIQVIAQLKSKRML